MSDCAEGASYSRRKRPLYDPAASYRKEITERAAKQRHNGMAASYSRMKWQQGLAVITRAEHWDLASKHLWGLSGSDIAAFLHSPLPHTAPVSAAPPGTESCPDVSPATWGEGYKGILRGRKIESATAIQEV